MKFRTDFVTNSSSTSYVAEVVIRDSRISEMLWGPNSKTEEISLCEPGRVYDPESALNYLVHLLRTDPHEILDYNDYNSEPKEPNDELIAAAHRWARALVGKIPTIDRKLVECLTEWNLSLHPDLSGEDDLFSEEEELYPEVSGEDDLFSEEEELYPEISGEDDQFTEEKERYPEISGEDDLLFEEEERYPEISGEDNQFSEEEEPHPDISGEDDLFSVEAEHGHYLYNDLDGREIENLIELSPDDLFGLKIEEMGYGYDGFRRDEAIEEFEDLFALQRILINEYYQWYTNGEKMFFLIVEEEKTAEETLFDIMMTWIKYAMALRCRFDIDNHAIDPFTEYENNMKCCCDEWIEIGETKLPLEGFVDETDESLWRSLRENGTELELDEIADWLADELSTIAQTIEFMAIISHEEHYGDSARWGETGSEDYVDEYDMVWENGIFKGSRRNGSETI